MGETGAEGGRVAVTATVLVAGGTEWAADGEDPGAVADALDVGRDLGEAGHQNATSLSATRRRSPREWRTERRAPAVISGAPNASARGLG